MSRSLETSGPLRVVFLAVCLYSLALEPRVFAGQENASIIGRVTDESGLVLPGVVVTATGPALQIPQVASVTDDQGEYRLTTLPIGTYEVTYALDGFQAVKREQLRLTVGFTAKVDIVLKIGSISEAITVTGSSPVVDVTSTNTETHLTRETIELIPTGRNGIIGLMAQAPGVRPNIDVGGNTINDVPVFKAFGQSGESYQMIEGLAAYSPKSGTQSAQFWDYSVFEEAKIETVAHDASTPTRGVTINAIVKSGGNDFHGNVFWAQTGHRLQSNNISSELAAQGITKGNPIQKRYDVSADLGGRIIRDKLWFYYATRRRFDIQEVVNTYQPDGSPATLPSGQIFSTEKLSYQMSPSNRISGFAMWTRKDHWSGLNERTDWDSRSQQINDAWNTKAEWQSVRSNSIVTSLGFGVWGFYSTYYGFSDKPSTTDQLTGRVTGINAGAGQSPLEWRYHWNGSVSWFRPDLLGGNHQFKAGADYMLERADRPYISRGAAGNHRLVFRNGVPFQIQTYNYPVDPIDRRNYLGTFVTDSWTIGRRLTLNLGVRYAHDAGFIPEQCRPAADPPGQVAAPAQCFERKEFRVWNPVVPRIHAAYDLSGDGRTSVKGGWARYPHGRMMDELQQANALAANQSTYNWRDLNSNLAYDTGEVNLDPNGPDFVSTNLQGGGAPSNGVPNPNEREPMSDELSLAFERELVENLAIRVTGIYSRNTNVYRLQNNRRPYEVYNIPITRPDPGPDGALNTADDTGRSLTYFDYPSAYAGVAFQEAMLVNDPAASQTYKSVELAVSRRLSNGWQFMGSFSTTFVDDPYVFSTGGGLTLGINELTPNAEIFSADNTRDWLGRASAAYNFPYGILVSANFEHRSGEPFARTVSLAGGQQIRSLTVRVEPIGTQRYPNVNLLDLRTEKTFRIGQGHGLQVRANIYNFTNASTVTNFTSLSGPNYLRPTAILNPRIVELSASYRF